MSVFYNNSDSLIVYENELPVILFLNFKFMAQLIFIKKLI